MVQACLNGSRTAEHGAAVPMSPKDLARSAADAVAAGATEIHVHPKCPCGHDSLSPRRLLYTSDAADDTPCVVLGGPRLLKQKKHHTPLYTTNLKRTYT